MKASRMKPLAGVILVALAAVAAPAIAQSAGTQATVVGAKADTGEAQDGPVVAKAPGAGALGEVVTTSATITAIDRDKRVVTLKDAQGHETNVVAGPEVRNFDQLKVGDQIVVSHLEAVTIELRKGGGIRERFESTTSDRAAPGAKPGGMVASRVTVVADVVAVNARTQTLTLRGPQRTVNLRVPDPKQFALVKVGDQVEATFTEAVAVAVEPAPRK